MVPVVTPSQSPSPSFSLILVLVHYSHCRLCDKKLQSINQNFSTLSLDPDSGHHLYHQYQKIFFCIDHIFRCNVLFFQLLKVCYLTIKN